MKSAPTRVSILLLVGVFVLCLYRAATQSFTIDESFTFLRYVDTPWRDVFGDYSANNHVLFSLVSRIFRYKFGRSEIILRIPTLIGCILFLLASFRIGRVAIGDRWLLPLGLALLTLNPMVLDFFVAARGYGLGLGLYWWALYFVWTARFWAAGVLAGLAIATNLIFVLPLAALGFLALLIYARQNRVWEVVTSYGIPALLIPFLLLVVPVSKGAGQFYYGAATLTDTIGSLVGESLRQPPVYAEIVAPMETKLPPGFMDRQFVPAMFWLGTLAGVGLLVRAVQNAASSSAILLAFTLLSMAICVALWWAMHVLLGFVYPLNRTALYMLPLFALAVAVGAATSPSRAISAPLVALGVILTVLYVLQLRTTHFSEWRVEAGMSRLVKRLGADASSLGKSREVTAGGTWILEYSARYYSKRHRLPWLKVLDAVERQSIAPDYYLLTHDEAGQVDSLHLTVVEKDELSGTILARRN